MPALDPLRRRIAREVRATVSGAADGGAAIAPGDDGYFPPGSIVRAVHGDVTSMMVGGIAALLMQMLHPAVLAGVWDHSNFRADMLGRLHRTARFIAVTTYGARGDADRAIARVRAIHAKLGGTLPDGTPYRVADPRLLAWVHVCEAVSFHAAWRRYTASHPTAHDEAAYLAAFAPIAEQLGAAPVPHTRVEADALIATMRPELRVDARTLDVARRVTRPSMHSLAALPSQMLLIRAAIDLLPGWARRMHGFPHTGPLHPLVHIGTIGIATTLRWALATPRDTGR